MLIGIERCLQIGIQMLYEFVAAHVNVQLFLNWTRQIEQPLHMFNSGWNKIATHMSKVTIFWVEFNIWSWSHPKPSEVYFNYYHYVH